MVDNVNPNTEEVDKIDKIVKLLGDIAATYRNQEETLKKIEQDLKEFNRNTKVILRKSL